MEYSRVSNSKGFVKAYKRAYQTINECKLSSEFPWKWNFGVQFSLFLPHIRHRRRQRILWKRWIPILLWKISRKLTFSSFPIYACVEDETLMGVYNIDRTLNRASISILRRFDPLSTRNKITTNRPSRHKHTSMSSPCKSVQICENPCESVRKLRFIHGS